jgi:uncharacterized protein YhhL (DUF1145 family)
MNFRAARAVLICVWILIALNLFVEFPVGVERTLNTLGLLLAIAHIFEYVAFRKVIAKRPEPAMKAFILTFLFGLFYWKE